MILIETAQQGGGEGGKAVLRGVFRRALDAVLIAVAAAVVDVLRHGAHELAQAVVLLYDDLYADGGGKLQQAVAPRFVFFPRMDVGIVPERHWLNALGAQRIDAGEGAGRTAGMHQDLVSLLNGTSIT